MGIVKLCILLMVVTFGVANGQLGKIGKTTYWGSGKVLQVLDSGLLVSGNRTVLLIGSPKHKKGDVVDGDFVYCWVKPMKKNYVYINTLGAKKTIRVYKFLKIKKRSKIRKSGSKKMF